MILSYSRTVCLDQSPTKTNHTNGNLRGDQSQVQTNLPMCGWSPFDDWSYWVTGHTHGEISRSDETSHPDETSPPDETSHTPAGRPVAQTRPVTQAKTSHTRRPVTKKNASKETRPKQDQSPKRTTQSLLSTSSTDLIDFPSLSAI